MQYSITNQAGRSAYQCVIELTDNDSTTAINSHVDITESDVIDAVANLGNCFILAKTIYNETGTQVEAQHQYHSRPPVPGSGAPTGEGSPGTNYDITTFAYDAMGRRIRSVTPAGTISRTNYDELGRTTSNEIGTDDTGDPGSGMSGTNNMVTVSETIFDGGSDGGNSFVTKTIAYVEDSATNKRETSYAHDVRGRVLLTTYPAEPKFSLNKYDNLGRSIASAMYKDGTVSSSDNPITRSTDRLTLNRSYFDEMGRTWKTTRHKINTSSGADDDSLTSLTWYDKVGRVMKAQGEQLIKASHDRIDRMTHQFTLASTDDSSYADAQTVTGDIVLEEHQTVYDPDGSEVLMQVVIQRTHDDFGMGETTGALDTNADGDPLIITAANLKGRAQITSMWYDDLHRLTDTVMYGTAGLESGGGGSTFDRTSLAIPARSDTALRTTYTYDLRGRTDTVEDPKGRKTKSEYDDANRQLKAIRNYDPNTNSGLPSGTDVNQTVEYIYDDGLRTKIIAVMPNSADNQETVYSYGVAKGASAGDSRIASNDVLHTTTYPDSAGGSDVVTYAYNAQGQMFWTKDQAGRVMEYTYDLRGRREKEEATALGGFDGYIRRIETTFDDWGRTSLVTSYDNSTNVRNEVKYQYDGWGNLIEFDQNPTGAVPGSTSDYAVQYTYAKNEPTGARHTLRRTEMTLPNGDVITYHYSSTGGLHDDEASRVTELKESSTVRVTYRYLGVGQLVGTTFDQPGLNSHLYDGSNDYDALDRFNRTTISRWTKSGQSDRYNVTLTYDRNSNILTLDDSVQTPGSDWKYTYDALDRLIEAQAGTLSAGSISSETRQQVWDLDHAGNWTHTDLEENNTTTIFDWDFTHNKVNEITGWDNQSTEVNPTYDAAGNLTNDQRSWKYTYDAWYRLVEVHDQSDNLKAQFRYNGLGYRVSMRYDDTDPWYHFAYDERWRIVAMFEDSDTDPTEQFWYQNAGLSGYGSSSYIDEVVLRDRDTDGNGSLDERLYYCQNWHHDVVALCDTSGSIEERINYDAYGSPIGTFTAAGNRKGYAGYEYDTVLSNTYYMTVNGVYRSDLAISLSRRTYPSGLHLYHRVPMPGSLLHPQSNCTIVGDTTCAQVRSGDCGAFSCPDSYFIQGHVNPCKGFPVIVQKVDIFKLCGKCCEEASRDLAEHPFYEILPWHPKAHENRHWITYCEGRGNNNSWDKSWGELSIHVEARLFCEEDLGEREWNDLANWGIDRVGKLTTCFGTRVNSGVLPHSTVKPSWWDKNRCNKLFHLSSGRWDCCPGPLSRKTEVSCNRVSF